MYSAPDCGSNPGWRKNNDICYYYNDTDIVDFHTAMIRCYNEKARLVSILSRDEQAYVNSMVRLGSFGCFRAESLQKSVSLMFFFNVLPCFQVGTGQVASAWIGMRMLGIASGQYM